MIILVSAFNNLWHVYNNSDIVRLVLIFELNNSTVFIDVYKLFILINMIPQFNCIAAVCENMGIGKNSRLPWKLKWVFSGYITIFCKIYYLLCKIATRSEMEYFNTMTTRTTDESKRNIVTMGRKTWESIPPKFKPLKNRINFILSTSELDFSSYRDVYGFKNLDDAVNKLKDDHFKNQYETVWVIGGSKVYQVIFFQFF